MKTIPMNLTIDRHITNGSAAISGAVNGERVQIRVERGVEDGNAYVNGQVGADSVRLTFARTADNGYESARGHYGKTQLDAQIRRYQPDGDTSVSANGKQLLVDRQHQGQRVALHSSVVEGGFERQLRDGDEFGRMSVGRNGFDYSLDRDQHSGGFVLEGRTAEGPFRLDARRSASDGDLNLSGTVPEDMLLFPLLWEVLGDDKNIPDRNPEYPGSLMAMSVFLQNRG
jgi:hypothetical protein